ncbi:CPA2 family monovalent cation:H+ antiporter-2 [Pullulanibacillus pueri]|uniref:Putative Na(+)/H(+) antiporter YjbQ n=1 Tax=Pullulanibacillus pueri TaxID=1437324 RepID=A0A8J2ZV88_9BACL|nr:monovalent cation:proton antiporter family protein [Pullulanibacillus pueri]MBM7682065.1 CPA2 family monovalent cation:H+ antiporter-2 [Pullulanibacillus pueri]GGH80113.1 putative Na(+)/H(+) antiporter YjbQ [Pullulanibacillus pueri]
MEIHSSISSLVIVLLAAFLTPIILKKLRLNIIPVVVAEIIVGLIIGHSGFDLIHPGDWINILSTLGFIFLMFLSGLEIDFSVFFNSEKGGRTNESKEPNRFLIALLVFGLILVVSYIISISLVAGHFTDNAFFMTLVISTISLGIVVPTLKESNVMRSGIGQTILIIAVIADLVTMILLAIFVSFYEGGGNTWLLLILFGAGIVLYFIAKFLRHRSLFESLSAGTVQIGTRAIFTLIILLVALSESVGAENILGAFLAGVLVSLLSPNKEMVKQLDSFGYGFLIPIFFVMVGVDLNLREMFHNKSIFLLIPILFVGLLLSKLIPVLVLKKWYDWRTVLGSGFLLTSTLSLVVAASKVGERIHVISSEVASALILLAIITCIITPILFKKVFPFHALESKRKKVVILGANQITLPLASELDQNMYESHIYHTNKEMRPKQDYSNMHYIKDFSIETLEKEEIFSADTIVTSTSNDSQNALIAECAQQRDVKGIVARVESPQKAEELKNRGIHVVSSFFSTMSMMKAMIESPNIASLFTTKEDGLHQIILINPRYSQTLVRDLDVLEDAIIVRIYRDKNSLIPHGNTRLLKGDRLILTGKDATIQKLRQEFK